MPINSPEARTLALRSIVGVDRAAVAPDSYTVHLFTGDPLLDGVELSASTEIEDDVFVSNGYDPATVSADDFTFDGEIATVPAGFVPDQAYSASASHWLMRSGGVDWFSGGLLEPLDVLDPGDPFTVACSVLIDNLINEDPEV